MKLQGRLFVLLMVVTWTLEPGIFAAPPKPAKSKKEGDLTTFKDIPTLPNCPDKDCYAVFYRKAYDVLVVASNLMVYVYPKDKGERLEKPIIFSNRFMPAPGDDGYRPLIAFTGVCNLPPPATNAPKLVITAVASNGATLYQSWKFGDNKIDMEESVTDLSDKGAFMRTTFHWPETHKFTPNIEKADRAKAVTDYTLRWHAGKTWLGLKTLTVHYADAVTGLSVSDWVENQGPWGSHKVLIKRKGTKGNIVLGWNPVTAPYVGLEFQYAVNSDPKTKRFDGAGLEIKIE